MLVGNSFVYLGNSKGEVQIRHINILTASPRIINYPGKLEINSLLSHNNRLLIGGKGGKFLSIWHTNDLIYKECGRIICENNYLSMKINKIDQLIMVGPKELYLIEGV